MAFEYLWERISGQAPGTPGGLLPSLAVPDVSPTSAVNFAFGGTGTDFITITPGGFEAPGLKGQIAMLQLGLAGRTPSPDALFAIVTGANDYRDDQFMQPEKPQEVVENIAEAVVTLHAMGARHVMVLSLPDLGLVPANAGDAKDQSKLSRKHNRLLQNALRKVAHRHDDLNVIYVDINDVLDQLPAGMDRTTPALDVLFPPEVLPPGFRMSLCLFIDPATCADVPTFDVGENFMFWDIVHPTTAVHRLIGDYLFQSLQ
jgi:phospholipase/lecithinase/hemolysin